MAITSIHGSMLCTAAALIVVVSVMWQIEGQAVQEYIVQDVNTDCPVPNVLFTDDEYTNDRLFTTLTPLVTTADADPCAPAATELTVCATDGTLKVKEGCCSIECATRLQNMIKAAPECYRHVVEFFCTNPDLKQGLMPSIFSAARRCVGLNATCDLLSLPGDLLPPSWKAVVYGPNVTTGNVTVNGTAAGADGILPGANATGGNNTTPQPTTVLPAAAASTLPAANSALPAASVPVAGPVDAGGVPTANATQFQQPVAAVYNTNEPDTTGLNSTLRAGVGNSTAAVPGAAVPAASARNTTLTGTTEVLPGASG